MKRHWTIFINGVDVFAYVLYCICICVVQYLYLFCTVFVFVAANDDGEGSVELCLCPHQSKSGHFIAMHWITLFVIVHSHKTKHNTLKHYSSLENYIKMQKNIEHNVIKYLGFTRICLNLVTPLECIGSYNTQYTYIESCIQEIYLSTLKYTYMYIYDVCNVYTYI